MSNIFYPGLLTPDEVIKVMGEPYWPVLVTLNATLGYQVAIFADNITAHNKSGVGVVNKHGTPALNVHYGLMQTRKGKSLGKGVSIIDAHNTVRIKSSNANYVNRAINNSPELKKFLEETANDNKHTDNRVLQVVNSYRRTNSYGNRSIYLNTDQTKLLLKQSNGEDLDVDEKIDLEQVLEKYRADVYDPNRLFTEAYNDFFNKHRAAYLNVIQTHGQNRYVLGVINPLLYLGANKHQEDSTTEWITPIKWYKDLNDIEDEELKSTLFSRLVMFKLRHGSKTFIDKDNYIPLVDNDFYDGLMLSCVRHGYNSRQTMLINLG